jgi:hypothetical protein
MALFSWPSGAAVTTIYHRDECIEQASQCRAKAQSDPARHDYWIDEAIAWLQRATETRHENATHEIHDERMLPKLAK